MASSAKPFSRRSVLGVIAMPFVLPSVARADADVPAGFTSVRIFGAKGDGATDDTEALTWAHSSGNPLFYPRTEAFYRISNVLPAKAPATSDGAEIRIVGDGTHPKTIFRVTGNPAPIEISGFTLDGGWKGETKGEWSHGIDISGANNVTVAKNTIRNPYGDCVYVGSADNKVGSGNIWIHDNVLINPRRCNVAIVCGEDVVIENNSCTLDSDYVAGIDLEPDLNHFDYVRRVRILNNNFRAKGKFIAAGVNNGAENTGLVVSGNRGQALEYLHVYENALLRNATITRNTFSANSPKGVMMHLESVYGEVLDNVDNTACGDGYRSVDLRDCHVALRGNRFCG